MCSGAGLKKVSDPSSRSLEFRARLCLDASDAPGARYVQTADPAGLSSSSALRFLPGARLGPSDPLRARRHPHPLAAIPGPGRHGRGRRRFVGRLGRAVSPAARGRCLDARYAHAPLFVRPARFQVHRERRVGEGRQPLSLRQRRAPARQAVRPDIQRDDRRPQRDCRHVAAGHCRRKEDPGETRS